MGAIRLGFPPIGVYHIEPGTSGRPLGRLSFIVLLFLGFGAMDTPPGDYPIRGILRHQVGNMMVLGR